MHNHKHKSDRALGLDYEAMLGRCDARWAIASAEMQSWRAEMYAHVEAIMQRALRAPTDSAEAVHAVTLAQNELQLLLPVGNDVLATQQAACEAFIRVMQDHRHAPGVAFVGSLLSRISDYTIDPRDVISRP
jgi:hypothetical protein